MSKRSKKRMEKRGAPASMTQGQAVAGERSSASGPALHSPHKRPRSNSRYAAATSTTRLGNTWTPVTQNINTIISRQAGTIRARVQQLVRDFPYFKRACDVMVNYTVGTGIRYQPRVMESDGLTLNKRVNRYIEDCWNRWSDEIDLAHKMDLHGKMALSKRQDVESGEFISVLVAAKQPGRFIPFGIREYEADWLTSNNARGENNTALWDAATGISAPQGVTRAILGGVEYDIETGEILAVHLQEPGSFKHPVRVPAQFVVHGHDVLRPNQMRGISPFVTAILVAHSLSEIMGAELDAVQMASKWLGFVTTADPMGFQQNRITDTETNSDGSSKKIEEMENAILEYLQPGETVNFSASNRPGNNFEAFTRLIIRMVAITVGVSYEILSGDYAGLSYSNLKPIRNDMLEGFDPIIARHVFQYCKPVHNWFLTYGVLSGAVELPGFYENPAPYYRAYWQPPGHRLLDPLRETKANIEQVKALTKSPQEICRERGRDFDEVLMEISEATDRANEQGLDLLSLLGMVSTATANNPAALGSGDEGTNSDKGGKLYAINGKKER